MESVVHQPPPELPELPEGVDPAPRWPAWYALAAFGVGLVGTLILVGIVAAATGVSPDEENATFTIVATLVQNMVFVSTALVFAAMIQRPRPWHFGLRRTRFWPAVGWAALGIFSFYLLAAVYAAIVQPEAEQSITDSLGANQGTFGLIAAGVMVICVAPVAEEVFFRGFFYRALRSRFSIWAAAAIDGAMFGIIHFDFSGAEALLILPPLALLGFIFCLVFERTGSLYPVIALHAINNTIAYGVQADTWEVPVVLGPLMIAVCCLAPRLGRRGHSPPAARAIVPSR